MGRAHEENNIHRMTIIEALNGKPKKGWKDSV
jgi:hypothetical protein